jgi:6,7-dimethyl-8-ribityllumazine synthase
MADIKKSTILKTTGILKTNACVVLVKTEWNAAITDKLEKGCREELKRSGIRLIKTITVPGAVEIPFAIKSTWENAPGKDKPAAFVALGCVIKGDTPHFDYVCQSVTLGVLHLNLQLPVPVIFGVLTVNNEKQALERTGGKHGHKGVEAAATAVKMMMLNIPAKK